MTTQVAPSVADIHLACDSYCGRRIVNPETDHAPDCGAPLAERDRIRRELRAMVVRAAARPDPGTEPSEQHVTVDGQVRKACEVSASVDHDGLRVVMVAEILAALKGRARDRI